MELREKIIDKEYKLAQRKIKWLRDMYSEL